MREPRSRGRATDFLFAIAGVVIMLSRAISILILFPIAALLSYLVINRFIGDNNLPDEAPENEIEKNIEKKENVKEDNNVRKEENVVNQVKEAPVVEITKKNHNPVEEEVKIVKNEIVEKEIIIEDKPNILDDILSPPADDTISFKVTENSVTMNNTESLPRRRISSVALETESSTNTIENAEEEQRKYVYLEILETEQIYVKDLEVLVNTFMKPLLDMKKPILDDSEMNLIFSPFLPQMLSVNQQLLENLAPLEILKVDKSGSSMTKPLDKLGSSMTAVEDHTRFSEVVAHSFLQIMPYFTMYSNYFTAYEKALETVKGLRENKPAFRAFLDKCQEQPHCRRLDLSSFLIKPIQRICKYPLFFRELLKHTPDGHPQKLNLIKANDMVNKIAAKVNTTMSERISIERVLEIAAQVDADSAHSLIQPHRRVLLESYYLVSVNGKKKSKHWIIIFNDLILLCQITTFSTKYSIRRLIMAEDIVDAKKLDPVKELALLLSFKKDGKEEDFEIFFLDEEHENDFVSKIKDLRNRKSPAGRKDIGKRTSMR